MFLETNDARAEHFSNSQAVSVGAVESPFRNVTSANDRPARGGPARRSRESYAPEFSPVQLRLARDMRSMPAQNLANKAGCALADLHAYESGTRSPSHATLLRLSLLLEVPVEFFAAEHGGMVPSVDDGHFRHLRAALGPARRQVVGQLAILSRFLDAASRYIEMPSNRIADLVSVVESEEEIEELAERAREVLGAGRDPIRSVVFALESQGACVRKLPRGLEEIGTFSLWHRGRPFVELRPGSSIAQSRVDAAHELGHLLMHVEPMPGHPGFERAAERFARALLLPRNAVRAECPRSLDYDGLDAMRARWGVPISVAIERAFELGALRESAYLTAKAEPEGRSRGGSGRGEEPKLVRGVLDMLVQDDLLEPTARSLGLDATSLLRILRH
jgi:Zn-dependent peptidase ImmA (M78 family)